jgi:hypothetical protein
MFLILLHSGLPSPALIGIFRIFVAACKLPSHTLMRIVPDDFIDYAGFLFMIIDSVSDDITAFSAEWIKLLGDLVGLRCREPDSLVATFTA